jgi:hypothetical protein
MAWNEPFDRPGRADLTGGVGLAPRYLNWCSINDPERIALGIGAVRISAFGERTSAKLLRSLTQYGNTHDHERQYEDRHDFNWTHHALPLGVAADRVQARFRRGFSPYGPANRLPRLAAHASASSLDPMATRGGGVSFRLNPSSIRIARAGSSSRR